MREGMVGVRGFEPPASTSRTSGGWSAAMATRGLDYWKRLNFRPLFSGITRLRATTRSYERSFVAQIWRSRIPDELTPQVTKRPRGIRRRDFGAQLQDPLQVTVAQALPATAWAGPVAFQPRRR